MESADLNLAIIAENFSDKLFASKNSSILVGSIGQSIVEQVRPNPALTPLQIGLAVQVHKHFGFRFRIDSLYSHGFSF